MVRRQAVWEAGLFNPSRLIVEDYDLRCRLGLVGKIDNLIDTCIIYRNRTGNTINTGRNRRKMKRRSLGVSLRYYRVYRAHPRSIISQIISRYLPASRYTRRAKTKSKTT
jgi:hypothetical protein